jgi:hypothetical protein
MSLITDKVFFNALKSNSELVSKVGGRIENTAITGPDEQLLNQPVPYIIIIFEDLKNEGFNKDNSFEGDIDKVWIGIEIAAEDRETLGDIAQAIRQTVKSYFLSTTHEKDDYDLVPEDYEFSASKIQYDPIKPCFWQILNYACDTNP